MNTYIENIELIRNSEKFIEINGVLPIEDVEELLKNMVIIKTNNFSNEENFESEIEKIAQLFKETPGE